MLDKSITLKLIGATQISEKNCLRLRLKIDAAFPSNLGTIEFAPENIAVSWGETRLQWECPKCDSLNYYSLSPGLYYLQPRYKCNLSEQEAVELVKANEELSIDFSRFIKINGSFLTIEPIKARIEYE